MGETLTNWTDSRGEAKPWAPPTITLAELDVALYDYVSVILQG